jgi:hypothetical protein
MTEFDQLPTSGPLAPERLRGPSFDRVEEAWSEAKHLGDPHLPAFEAAARAFGADARARGIPATEVLRALGAIIDPARGGDRQLDFDSVREHAGTWAIEGYYEAA